VDLRSLNSIFGNNTIIIDLVIVFSLGSVLQQRQQLSSAVGSRSRWKSVSATLLLPNKEISYAVSSSVKSS
jgi:hypothetical protein